MKHIETDIWCIGTDGESFFNDSYYSKEEAIADVKEEYEEGYVGRVVRIEFEEDDINSDDIIYRLGQDLFYDIGDVAQDWGITVEQRDELSSILGKVVIDYINKHGLQPTCYKVVDIEEVEASVKC